MDKKDKIERDTIIINKILRYTDELKRISEKFEIKTHNDLANEYIALSSATQTITNISELKKLLDNELLNKIPEFNKIKINTMRHIASHDYDNISPYAVFSVMDKLTSENIINEMEAIINDNKESGEESECDKSEQ